VTHAHTSFSRLAVIQRYIYAGWDHLTRSLTNCASYPDSKISGPQYLYVPVAFPDVSAFANPTAHCDVRVQNLPTVITGPSDACANEIPSEGLLYLEHPYIVPGGQFNEMYGWDSYFIMLGLLHDHREQLAMGILENFFFEIEHYGGVLNANRSYYLTRGQPPFLTSMILAVDAAERKAGRGDDAWLLRAYEYALKDYAQWTHEPHLAGDTGLSRFFDHGDGPVPEILGDPSEYYRGVANFFASQGGGYEKYLARIAPEASTDSVVGPIFADPAGTGFDEGGDASGRAVQGPRIALTAEYYKGDRAMRESGFDVCFRFGPFCADTHHYAPVCLNSLLYKVEIDLAEISVRVGRSEDEPRWRERASARQRKMNQFLWNESEGMFFDHDFVAGAQSNYKFATTFYPLWTGMASDAQARAVAANLKTFEETHGLATSRNDSQAQWDFPYGWAPLHLLAVDGLRRYGFAEDADRVAYKFLAMVLKNFERERHIREKYNVVTGSSETEIVSGYHQNVIGFGWTNGVFVKLLDALPREMVERLAQE
jgi:alpha,alpha-trehalase